MKQSKAFLRYRYMLNSDEVIKLGFSKIPTFTIMDSHEFDLGRGRRLSYGNIGTPNEMLFLTQFEYDSKMQITDCICLHNYDYNGFLTEGKLVQIIEALKP